MEKESSNDDHQIILEVIKSSNLLLDLLSFSAASFWALARRYSVSDDKPSIDIVEKYILEQLDVTKDSVSEVKMLALLSTRLPAFPSLITSMALSKALTSASPVSQLLNVSFKGHFEGSKVGGREEEKSEGSSKIGSSVKVTEGLRKWAGLRVSLWSPMGKTMNSSLNLKMVFGVQSLLDVKRS
ncbi:hypothetical protein CFP56_023635 [Quercus suber]|uniref:Uncharacterized protein n=1 Tax=Quercus suber TaxID=58331 RepID=A0AAW0LY12_QUESU